MAIIFTGYYRLIIASIFNKDKTNTDRRLYIYLFVLIYVSQDYFTMVINGGETHFQSSFWLVLLVENSIELIRTKFSE